MRLFNVIFLLLVSPLVLMLAFEHGLLDAYVDDTWLPAEPFIRAELGNVTNGADLSLRAQQALADGDYDDAEMYAGMATYIGTELTPEAKAELDKARSLPARVTRNTGSFFEGFVYGEGNDTASFIGAVTSDLTVIGDVRDISQEGTKMLRGEDYSQLILGLSVVGLAATTATVATGGTALPARIGVSILKVAKKAGTLTAGFTRELREIISQAVNFPKLKETLAGLSLTDTAATRRAIANYRGNISTARLSPLLDDITVLQRQVGPAESVRLMARVETAEDLKNLRHMSATLGPRTRGVVTLTGKTSLRAFKTLANFVLWIIGWLWAAVAALGVWLLGKAGRRIVLRRKRTLRAT